MPIPSTQAADRAERMAAKLRENLRRRKVQAKAQAEALSSEPRDSNSGAPLPKDESKS